MNKWVIAVLLGTGALWFLWLLIEGIVKVSLVWNLAVLQEQLPVVILGLAQSGVCILVTIWVTGRDGRSA